MCCINLLKVGPTYDIAISINSPEHLMRAPAPHISRPQPGRLARCRSTLQANSIRIGRQWRANKQQPSISFLVSKHPPPCSPKLTKSVVTSCLCHLRHRTTDCTAYESPSQGTPSSVEANYWYLPGGRYTAVPPTGGAQGVQRRLDRCTASQRIPHQPSLDCFSCRIFHKYLNSQRHPTSPQQLLCSNLQTRRRTIPTIVYLISAFANQWKRAPASVRCRQGAYSVSRSRCLQLDPMMPLSSSWGRQVLE